MKSANSFRKIGMDLTLAQLSWAVWFGAFALAAYIVFPLIGINIESNNKLGQLFSNVLSGSWDKESFNIDNSGFIAFIANPSKIFMLVCGILSVPSFLTFFVKQGLTRKDYFYGAAVSSVAVAFVLAIVSGVVFLIEQLIFAPELQLDYAWPIAIVVYGLNILAYYAAGWLIGAGFYRFSFGGLLFILLAILLAIAVEVMWEMPLSDTLKLAQVWSGLVSILATVVLIGASFTVVRIMTKRIRIKLK